MLYEISFSADPTFTLKNVLNALHAVVEWKSLGVQLDISVPKIDEIDVNNRGQVAECRYALVKFWLESDVSCSWKKLIDALLAPAIGKSALAEEIRNKYCPICQGMNVLLIAWGTSTLIMITFSHFPCAHQ